MWRKNTKQHLGDNLKRLYNDLCGIQKRNIALCEGYDFTVVFLNEDAPNQLILLRYYSR